MKIERFAEGVTLYCGDCREVLPTLPAVDLVVTSPPYANQRNYVSFNGDDLSVGFLKDTPAHEKTQIFINLGLIHQDGEVIEYWNPIIANMRSKQWRLFGWYVWDQGDGLPGNWNGRLAPSHEFIFHFNKQARTVNKWTKSLNPRPASGTGLRQANGETAGISSPHLVGQIYKVADSVFRVYRQMARNGPEADHPAVFPIGLPGSLISSFSDAGETVCDPFMGSGTTGVAAVGSGRKFTGIEIEPKYFEIACKRVEHALKQGDIFIKQFKILEQQLELI